MFTNPLQKLFPTPQDNYGGLLDPQAIQGAQQQQLLRFAAGLLGRTSGYSPTEAIGQSFNDLPDWNQVLHGMVGQRVAMRDAQRKMEQDAARKAMVAQTANIMDPIARLKAMAGMAGGQDPQMLNAIAQALNALGSGDAFKVEEMLDDKGQRMLYRIHPTGERELLGPAPPKELSLAQQLNQQQRQDMWLANVSNEYQQDTTPIRNSYRALTRSLRSLPQAREGNGAAQIEMTYAFITTIDQGIVKEGEVALVRRNASSTLEQARQWLKNNFGNANAVMPPELAARVADLVDGVKQQYDRELGQFRTHYERRIQHRYPQVDPGYYLPDLTDIIGSVSADTRGQPRGGAATKRIEEEFLNAAGAERSETTPPVPPKEPPRRPVSPELERLRRRQGPVFDPRIFTP